MEEPTGGDDEPTESSNNRRRLRRRRCAPQKARWPPASAADAPVTAAATAAVQTEAPAAAPAVGAPAADRDAMLDALATESVSPSSTAAEPLPEDTNGSSAGSNGGGAIVAARRPSRPQLEVGGALAGAPPADRIGIDALEDDEHARFHKSLRLSLEVSLRFLQERNVQAYALLAVLTLLPGGALEADLDAIWAPQHSKDSDPPLQLSPSRSGTTAAAAAVLR